MRSPEQAALARAVRRRALGNMILGLLDAARGTAERLVVEPLEGNAVLLHFRDVRTLVRRGESFAFAHRDCTLAVGLPEEWPFRRAAMPHPIVLQPGDTAHPNGTGRVWCLDTAGVMPARLADLLYQNLALQPGHFRLDHPVDRRAADFVRAHLADLPADPRPLRAVAR